MLPDHWPGATWGSPLAVTRRGSVAVLQVRLRIFLWSHSHQLKFLLRSTPHSHQLIENANSSLIFTSWPPAEHWQRTRTRCTTGACLSRGPAWGNTGKVSKRKLPGLLWVFKSFKSFMLNLFIAQIIHFERWFEFCLCECGEVQGKLPPELLWVVCVGLI